MFDDRAEGRESVAEIHVACRLCRGSPSSEASRRARTGRLLLYHDDAFRRAAGRAATDAQVAEAAADTRVAVFHVAVVCCVVSCVSLFLSVLTFGTSLFPRHPPSVLFGRYR